jgi:hypothetical protein
VETDVRSGLSGSEKILGKKTTNFAQDRRQPQGPHAGNNRDNRDRLRSSWADEIAQGSGNGQSLKRDYQRKRVPVPQRSD